MTRFNQLGSMGALPDSADHMALTVSTDWASSHPQQCAPASMCVAHGTGHWTE